MNRPSPIEKKFFRKAILNEQAIKTGTNFRRMKKVINPLIFVVEDDPFYKELTKSKLNTNGFNNVWTFGTGKSCIERLHLKPDMIILDYLLGDMNGIDVMEEVRKQSPTSEVIILSGQQSIETSLRTLKYGAKEYLVKDHLSLNKLMLHVKSFVNRQKEKRQAKLSFLFRTAILISVITSGLFYFIG